MDDLNKRFNDLFSELNISQSDLARTLNITPAYVWKLLNKEDSIPSDRLINDICEKYDVSKEWFYHGAGDMFINRSRSEKITDFSADLLKEEEESFRRRFIEALSELDIEEWELLEKIASKITKKKD